MKTLNFSICINAPKETVWSILWSDSTYPQWTAAFAEGSKATSDWKEGSSILFTDGNNSGMYSIIERKETNNKMTFKHLGMLKNGVEMPSDEQSKLWSGSLEDYQLKEMDGKTTVYVALDSLEDYADYFDKTFPKALQKVKELSEKKNH